jgi:hypothetical protein
MWRLRRLRLLLVVGSLPHLLVVGGFSKSQPRFGGAFLASLVGHR